MAKFVSCGVVVTNGRAVLLGHTTRSRRWDIPKGVAKPGEGYAVAATRELEEETGLIVPPASLSEIGTYPYLPEKSLVLFSWEPREMPDPERLHCRSTFTIPSGAALPEFDRFGLFGWNDALKRVGKNLARVLAEARSDMRYE